MRRLPIFFLIDVSESMVGKPIECVENGIATIIRTLKQSPYALETTVITVIVFAGKTKKIVSMQDLYTLDRVKLPIGGGTSLGHAMDFLMMDLSLSVKKNSYEEKGDWRPLIFLFTDGNPTDDVTQSAARWKENFSNNATFVAISIGDNVDTRILKQFTPNVFLLKNTDTASFEKFFDWITESINSSSKSVASSRRDSGSIDASKSQVLSSADESEVYSHPDEQHVVILGRCQNYPEQFYLVKYEKTSGAGEAAEYQLEGCYPLKDEMRDMYFDLSVDDAGKQNQRINTDHLYGHPKCPICGNYSAIGICSCGGVLCVKNNEWNVCPHCGKRSFFGSAKKGLDIARTIG